MLDNQDKILTEQSQDVEADKIEQESTSEEVITQPFSPNEIKLSNPPMNLGDLIDRIMYKWVNLNTEYQREMNLWTPTQQSRLIESVLLGLRLPAFYFEEVNTNHWNIIDGLQRCCAIKNFCVDKSLKLLNLEFLDKYNGKYFDDLQFETIRDIRMLPITVNVLERGVPDQVKYILFKRLNTGGIELTSQEIRNAMFIGRAIDTVRRMARQDEAFKQATDYRVPSFRHVDMDFVSRFVAFYRLGYNNYEPDLEHFINMGMSDLRDRATDIDIAKMESDFHKSMVLAYEIFGNRAFRKQINREESRRSINKAYFEVISSQFALLSEEQIIKLRANKDVLVDNLNTAMRESTPFWNSFSGGTGSVDSVRRRHSWFKIILEKSINGIVISINDDNKIEDREF